jgi:3',5'-cyclic-AMP phosphodiesterase
MRFALITDQHFGPPASFAGKLRKLSHQAERLCRDFVTLMNDTEGLDLVVNLGDVIEDESPALDRERYQRFVHILGDLNCPILHVAGNHDSVNLTDRDLLEFWERSGKLYYSADIGGLHVVVLHSIERKDRDVRLPDDQLAWLTQDLHRTALPTVVFVHHPLADMDLTGNRWFEKAPHICRVANRRAAREILHKAGNVRAVFNGHAHWNHVDVIGGIPYVTLQSLIENLDDDAPGRPAAAHALVDVSDKRVLVSVAGEQPARYQFDGC